MKITWTEKTVDIDEIKPSEYNPRRITDHDFEALKRSLSEYGHCYPVVCNTDMKVIGGHQTLRAAKQLGWKQIAVKIPNKKLSKLKEKALNLALNRIHGEWDEDKLQLILSELYDSDIDFNLTGFIEEELTELIEALNPPTIDLDNFQNTEYDNKEGHFKLILFLSQKQANRLKKHKPKEETWENYIISLLPTE